MHCKNDRVCENECHADSIGIIGTDDAFKSRALGYLRHSVATVASSVVVATLDFCHYFSLPSVAVFSLLLARRSSE